MRTVAITSFEIGLLLWLAASAGLAYNDLRQDRIEVRRNYFPDLRGPRGGARPQAQPAPPTLPPADVSRHHDSPATAGPGAQEPKQDPSEEQLPEHGFQVIDAPALLDYISMANSAIVVIDSRDEEHFQDLHLPGALLFNYYMPDRYIGDVLAAAEYAEVFIVYCGGGTCTDSIAAANYLTLEIPTPLDVNKLYVYEGGIKEWCKLGYPTEGQGQCEPPPQSTPASEE